MQVDELILVSVDDHVIEPGHLFDGRVAKRYADLAPRFTTKADGTIAWLYEGNEIPNPVVQAVVGRPKSEWGRVPSRLDEMRPGCYDIHSRVRDMDANGLLGSMCFPSFVGFAGRIFLGTDIEQSAAMVRAYNDWHIDEWAGTYPERFIPLAIPILADPNLAADEVHRVAAAGCHAVTFTSNPHHLGLPSFYTEHWDPFWRACEDNDVVVCIHIGSNGRAPTTSPDAPDELVYSLSPISSIEVASDLIWSRLFLRFPRLRVALSEGGIGWIPYFQERLDYLYTHTQHWSGTKLDDKLPSELFKEHVIVCFIDDQVGLETRNRMNLDNITWECDYPHSDTTWPESPEAVMRYFAGLSREEIDKFTHLNTMRHFRYDPFSVIPREQATVGALRQRAVGWSVDSNVLAAAAT